MIMGGFDVAGGQLDPRKSWQDLERGPNGLVAERVDLGVTNGSTQ